MTIIEHINNDLKFVLAPSDPSLYFKRSGEKLDGLTRTYLGDRFNAVNVSFEKLANLTLHKFHSKQRFYDAFNFYGTHW